MKLLIVLATLLTWLAGPSPEFDGSQTTPAQTLTPAVSSNQSPIDIPALPSDLRTCATMTEGYSFAYSAFHRQHGHFPTNVGDLVPFLFLIPRESQPRVRTSLSGQDILHSGGDTDAPITWGGKMKAYRPQFNVFGAPASRLAQLGLPLPADSEQAWMLVRELYCTDSDPATIRTWAAAESVMHALVRATLSDSAAPESFAEFESSSALQQLTNLSPVSAEVPADIVIEWNGDVAWRVTTTLQGTYEFPQIVRILQITYPGKWANPSPMLYEHDDGRPFQPFARFNLVPVEQATAF